MTVAASSLLDSLRAHRRPRRACLPRPATSSSTNATATPSRKTSPTSSSFPPPPSRLCRSSSVCNELNVPFLPRGAGTSLAGGCLPVGGGVMIALTRMKRILEVNLRDRYAVVEPGVVNLWLTNHLRPHGYHFAPDPSSQGACTIGGNVATNSGGPHTLKYGVTVNHVLGLEFVLPDGRVVRDRRPRRGQSGLRPDRRHRRLGGHVRHRHAKCGCGSRAIRRPIARCLAFSRRWTTPPTPSATSSAPASCPAALEMLDQLILQAVEAAFHFGFPLDAGAVLIMEVDGLDAGLDADAERIDRHRQEEQRAAKCAGPTPKPNGCCCGSAASRRSAPSAGWRRVTARRTAWCRAPSLPHILRDIQRIGAKYDIASPMSSMPATATFTRSCSSTNAMPTR